MAFDFEIRRGETLGLVGESGCGQTRAGRTILQLYPPTAGNVLVEGVDVSRLTQPELRRMRRREIILLEGEPPSPPIRRWVASSIRAVR